MIHPNQLSAKRRVTSEYAPPAPASKVDILLAALQEVNLGGVALYLCFCVDCVEDNPMG